MLEGLISLAFLPFFCHDLSPYNQLFLLILIRLQREAERSRKNDTKCEKRSKKYARKMKLLDINSNASIERQRSPSA